ncbi:MAG: putative component of type VI protein secretion system [Candidatus Promineifilaceae bacterium]|jgi:predicted component of type VI protein secretion system
MSVIRITWQNVFDANDRGELVQRMPVIIGRSAEAHLQPGDELGGVSRSHARIDLTKDGVTLTDLGSKNGTWLNGVPISAAPICTGDKVNIGAWQMKIYPQIHCSNPDCQKTIDHDDTMCRWCGQFTTDAVTREFRFA